MCEKNLAPGWAAVCGIIAGGCGSARIILFLPLPGGVGREEVRAQYLGNHLAHPELTPCARECNIPLSCG